MTDEYPADQPSDEPDVTPDETPDEDETPTDEDETPTDEDETPDALAITHNDLEAARVAEAENGTDDE